MQSQHKRIICRFWNTFQGSITSSMFTLKASNLTDLVKWLLLASTFMWWCKFNAWLKLTQVPSAISNGPISEQNTLISYFEFVVQLGNKYDTYEIRQIHYLQFNFDDMKTYKNVFHVLWKYDCMTLKMWVLSHWYYRKS